MFEWETLAGSEWTEGDIAGLKKFSCQACGASYIVNSENKIPKCPHCDSKLSEAADFFRSLKPDCLIPFKIDKETAVKKLRKYYKSKKLLPKQFKEEANINRIQGIYAPMWLYSANVNADVKYDAVKNTDSHYELIRNGRLTVENIPIDGSTRLNDDLMESIEPYKFKDAENYSQDLLKDYCIECFDVDAKTSEQRANARVRMAVEDAFKTSTSGYDLVTMSECNIDLEDGKAKFALYPVWLLTTVWKGKKYVFAMNGQTGKFVGETPVSKSLVIKEFFKAFGIMSIIVFIAELILNYVLTKVYFPKDGMFYAYRAIAALAIGLILGLFHAMFLKSRLAKAPKKSVAPGYAKERSIKIKEKQDNLVSLSSL